MPPHTNDSPPCCAKCGIVTSIPIYVPLEFGLPPLRVRSWLRGMLGTAMPEATVHEDNDLSRDEDDVRSYSGHALDGAMNSKPQSPLVQG
jgi:hypothetical protein